MDKKVPKPTHSEEFRGMYLETMRIMLRHSLKVFNAFKLDCEFRLDDSCNQNKELLNICVLQECRMVEGD